MILTREGLDEVAREGRVVAESCVDLARSWVGIAVKAGAAHPDVAPPTTSLHTGKWCLWDQQA